MTPAWHVEGLKTKNKKNMAGLLMQNRHGRGCEKPMLEDACVISWTNDLVAWGNHRPYMTGRFGTSGKQLLKTPAITDITQ